MAFMVNSRYEICATKKKQSNRYVVDRKKTALCNLRWGASSCSCCCDYGTSPVLFVVCDCFVVYVVVFVPCYADAVASFVYVQYVHVRISVCSSVRRARDVLDHGEQSSPWLDAAGLLE